LPPPPDVQFCVGDIAIGTVFVYSSLLSSWATPPDPPPPRSSAS
jgi:hypothetical protein